MQKPKYRIEVVSYLDDKPECRVVCEGCSNRAVKTTMGIIKLPCEWAKLVVGHYTCLQDVEKYTKLTEQETIERIHERMPNYDEKIIKL